MLFADLSEELNLLPSELADFDFDNDDVGNDDDDVGIDNDDAVDDDELEEDENEQLRRIFDEYEPGKVFARF